MTRTTFAALLTIGVLASLSMPVHAQSSGHAGSLAGLVIDRATQQPVSGATIVVAGTKLGAVSRPEGDFLIKNIPPGMYRITVTSVGYESKTLTDVSVRGEHTTNLAVILTAKDVQLEGAVVTAPLFEKNSDNITSSNKFNYEEVRRMPGSVEDVGRVAQSMPGVNFTDDGRNDLIVRGGAPTENLTLVDGFEIPNANHFGTQGAGGGPISMINVNFIDDVTLSSGGFGAEFGDKMSSVMNVKMREGNRNGFQGNVDLSITGLEVLLEGPVTKSGSYLFAVDRSYLNLIHNVIGISAVPNYQDVSAKVVYDLSPAHKLSLFMIGGLDLITFPPGALDTVGLQFTNTTIDEWQGTAGLSWRWLWGTSGYSDVAVFTNLFNYDIHEKDSLNNPKLTDVSHDHEFGLRAKAAWQLNKTFNLTSGGSVKLISANDVIYQRLDSVQVQDVSGAFVYRKTGGIDVNAVFTTPKVGLFSELSGTFNALIVTGGIRLDHFGYLTGTNTVVAPRLAASYAIASDMTVNASYGTFYQAPELVWLTTVPENRALSYMRSQHVILGVDYQINDDLKFSVEAYDKEYSDYPVSLNNPYYVFVNSGSENGASIPGAAHSTGTGTVRGIDFFLQKKLVGNYYGMIAYSLLQGKFAGDEGGLRPGAYEYPQSFQIVIGYVPSSQFEFSAKWRYTSGRPYTPFNIEQSTLQNAGVVIDAQYNQLQLLPYHRIDIRADYRTAFSWGNLIAYIEFQNVYARNNVLQIYWNTTSDRQGQVYQWGFLPVGGVKVEF